MLRMVLSNRNYKKKRVLENMIFSEAKILSSIYNLSWGGYGKKKISLNSEITFIKYQVITTCVEKGWAKAPAAAAIFTVPHPSLSETIAFV